MGKVKYTLKSNPEMSVLVPTEYAEKAGKLVKAILDKSPELKEDSHIRFLQNHAILPLTLNLLYFEGSEIQRKVLEDEIYMRVCILGKDWNMDIPERKEESYSLHEDMYRVMDYLIEQDAPRFWDFSSFPQ
jgi:hypothetical protein